MRRPLVGLGMGIGARLRPAAAQGGVVSPEHGVRLREGATDCTNTPKGSAGGGYSHRGSNSGDGVAQGVGGVNLAAELDGAWRRGRRGAWSRGSGLGGVRPALPGLRGLLGASSPSRRPCGALLQLRRALYVFCTTLPLYQTF